MVCGLKHPELKTNRKIMWDRISRTLGWLQKVQHMYNRNIKEEERKTPIVCHCSSHENLSFLPSLCFWESLFMLGFKPLYYNVYNYDFIYYTLLLHFWNMCDKTFCIIIFLNLFLFYFSTFFSLGFKFYFW